MLAVILHLKSVLFIVSCDSIACTCFSIKVIYQLFCRLTSDCQMRPVLFKLLNNPCHLYTHVPLHASCICASEICLNPDKKWPFAATNRFFILVNLCQSAPEKWNKIDDVCGECCSFDLHVSEKFYYLRNFLPPTWNTSKKKEGSSKLKEINQ